MAASSSGSNSLKEYLKRYESNEDEKKTKKKKAKKGKKPKPNLAGVLVVDEDPVWQKPVDLDEEENESADEEKPQIDEDIEVKRMRRLEQLRLKRAYNAISEDGSGWVSLSPKPSNTNSYLSPPRKPSDVGGEEADLSPVQQRRRHHTPSPEPYTKPDTGPGSDLSPPREWRARINAPSFEHEGSGREDNVDLSPPRQRQKRYHSPSPETKTARSTSPDLSLPRRGRNRAQDNSRASPGSDLSPPRNRRKDVDLSPPRKNERQSSVQGLHASLVSDLSPPRKNQRESFLQASLKEHRKNGLISGQDIREEIAKTKKDEWLRFKAIDPSISGRGAEPVYRDKLKGGRISKDDYLKSQQKVEEKPKEKKLEWGKGLAQKREAEARIQELEVEKEKPFARTRDDAELNKMLKERVRWGDPMAHLVKPTEHILADLGDNEKMKESGFVVPQDIPSHSWLKRGLDAAPNRYGLRPGRHWDGVDRSTGFEKGLFKRTNERQASEKEAYLWSVSDM